MRHSTDRRASWERFVGRIFVGCININGCSRLPLIKVSRLYVRTTDASSAVARTLVQGIWDTLSHMEYPELWGERGILRHAHGVFSICGW